MTCRDAPTCTNACDKCKGPQPAPGRPKGESEERKAGRREGAGRASAGRGGVCRRAGLPRPGGALSSAWLLSRPKAAGETGLPRSGPRRTPVSAASAKAAECWARDPRRRRASPDALFPGGHGRPRPPRQSLGAASDKEGSGLSGRTGSAPGPSGDLQPVSGCAPCAVARPPRHQLL